jgi:hypothetical protein
LKLLGFCRDLFSVEAAFGWQVRQIDGRPRDDPAGLDREFYEKEDRCCGVLPGAAAGQLK